jgi:hypothetical protein
MVRQKRSAEQRKLDNRLAFKGIVVEKNDKVHFTWEIGCSFKKASSNIF